MHTHQLFKGFQRLFADSFSDKLYRALQSHKYDYILSWGSSSKTREKLFIHDRIKLGEVIVPMTMGQGQSSTFDFRQRLFSELGFQMDAVLTTDELSVVENKHYLDAASTKADWVVAWIKQERQKFLNSTSGSKHTLFCFYNYLQQIDNKDTEVIVWRKSDRGHEIIIKDFQTFHRSTFITLMSLKRHFVLKTINQNSYALWNAYISNKSDILPWIYIERLETVGIKKRLPEAIKLISDVRGPPQIRQWIPKKLTAKKYRRTYKREVQGIKVELDKQEEMESSSSQYSSFMESDQPKTKDNDRKEKTVESEVLVKSEPQLQTRKPTKQEKTAAQLFNETKKPFRKESLLQKTLYQFINKTTQQNKSTQNQGKNSKQNVINEANKLPAPTTSHTSPAPSIPPATPVTTLLTTTSEIPQQPGQFQQNPQKTPQVSPTERSPIANPSKNFNIRHYSINLQKSVQHCGVLLKQFRKPIYDSTVNKIDKMLEELFDIADGILKNIGPIVLKVQQKTQQQQESQKPNNQQITLVLSSIKKQKKHKPHNQLELQYTDD